MAHKIVEGGAPVVPFDDLCFDNDVRVVGPLASDLKLLTGVAVEPVRISCRDIVPKRFGQLPLLSRREGRPGRADCKSGHRRDIEYSVHHRGQPRITATLPKILTVLHRVHERVVKAAHVGLRIRRERNRILDEHANDE